MNLDSNFAGYTDAEVRRWLHIRAIEWCAWPAFVSQPLIPVLLMVFPFWNVIGSLMAAEIFWHFVRYSFVSPTLAKGGALTTAFLKWPCALGSAVYLSIHRHYLLAAIALLWPLLSGFVNGPVILAAAIFGVHGQIGRIELEMAKRIGYVSEDLDV